MAKKTKKKTKKKTPAKTPAKKSAKKTAEKIEQKKPAQPDTAFEKAVAEAEAAAVPKIENRGGARPGAGRPEGLTAKKAKVKNLPQQPSTPIKHTVEGLFAAWALSIKIEDVELTEQEAFDESLSITQLQEYYFPGLVPEISEAWADFIFGSLLILKKRFQIISKELKRRAGQQGDQPAEPVQEVDGPAVHYKPGKGGLIHAVESSEVVKTTPDKKKVTCNVCKELFKKSSWN